MSGIRSIVGAFLIALPFRMASAAEPAAEADRTDYFRSIETVEYRGLQAQSRAQAVSLLKASRRVEARTASFEISVVGALRILGAAPVGHRETVVGLEYGPVTLDRDLQSQEVTTTSEGFQLPSTVVNQTIRQVARGDRRQGNWAETVVLDLSQYFPRELPLEFVVQPASIAGGAPDALLVGVKSGILSYQVAGANVPDGPVVARYKALLVYSPSQDRVYQTASSFTATYQNETVLIESSQFLSDVNGDKPLVQLVDAATPLGLARQAAEVRNDGPLPMWALQSIRSYDIVDAAAMTAAERSTNPVGIVEVGWSLYSSMVETAEWLEKVVGPGHGQAFLKSIAEMHTALARWLADNLGANPKLAELLADTVKRAAGILYPPVTLIPRWLEATATVAIAFAEMAKMADVMLASVNTVGQPSGEPPQAKGQAPAPAPPRPKEKDRPAEGDAKKVPSGAETAAVVGGSVALGLGTWYLLDSLNLAGGASCGAVPVIPSSCLGIGRNSSYCNAAMSDYSSWCSCQGGVFDVYSGSCR